MLSAIEVICFVACYIFVFLLEVLRFRFKQNSIWRVVSLALLLLGVFIHGVSLYQNNLLQNDHFFASASGWFSVLAFGLILVQVYLSLIYPKTQFGLFLLPLAFIVLILGWCAMAPFSRGYNLPLGSDISRRILVVSDTHFVTWNSYWRNVFRPTLSPQA